MTEIIRAQLTRGPNGEKDPNDFARSGNVHLLNDAIAEQAKAAEPAPPRFHLMTPDELASRPAAQYRIKRVLPAEGIAVIYGPPKSGKTFIVLDAAAAITEGREWFGYRTRPCPIVYVGLEGEGGLSQRWQAYRLVKGDTGKDRLKFVTAQLSLLLADDITDLANAIKAARADAGIVVIDTLNAASPGADENSSVDMGRIIAAAKRLQATLGGLVLLVHHAGKELSRGLRGHSSLSGAVDAILEVSRDNNDNREWAVTRAKDGPESEPRPFRLGVVELGTDEDGDPITSCIVEPVEARPQGKKPSRSEARALAAMREVMSQSKRCPPRSCWDAPKPPRTGQIACPLADLRAHVKRTGGLSESDNPDSNERALRRAIKGLQDAAIIEVFDDWAWLTDKADKGGQS
ncbi:AAA family ATPase [Thiocapsa roseopersicina]|uniref:AAA domain-containing protein n=1 Tax=Thiocapsa roseopersicina TaxID=1058 RepID=A0A1H3DSK1_THIRO|nr:AAA family ATPase [Thiocapsa roseopersicina]SDX68664.1 AAA domain-containing protein [Thiocapsa roseopersicina]